MPDLLVPVLALVGALIGAALQPATTYLMDRLRSGERIVKSRERTLRRMVETTLTSGRHIMGISAAAEMRPEGDPMPREGKLKMVLDALANPQLWTPERITDTTLRDMAVEYNQLAVELTSVLAQWVPDKGQAPSLRERLEGLQPRITARMDELKYPEVDD